MFARLFVTTAFISISLGSAFGSESEDQTHKDKLALREKATRVLIEGSIQDMKLAINKSLASKLKRDVKIQFIWNSDEEPTTITKRLKSVNEKKDEGYKFLNKILTANEESGEYPPYSPSTELVYKCYDSKNNCCSIKPADLDNTGYRSYPVLVCYYADENVRFIGFETSN